MYVCMYVGYVREYSVYCVACRGDSMTAGKRNVVWWMTRYTARHHTKKHTPFLVILSGDLRWSDSIQKALADELCAISKCNCISV